MTEVTADTIDKVDQTKNVTIKLVGSKSKLRKRLASFGEFVYFSRF